MPDLLKKPFGAHGKVHEITPQTAGWRYVGFSLYHLRAGDRAAEATGDNEVILYLVEKGADATVVSRRGHTTADMANGPVQRISPFPDTIELLESLGSKNNNNCVSCE